MCIFVRLIQGVLAAGIGLAGTQVHAQAADSASSERDIGLGLIAGATSGFGLNFRADLSPKWGASLSALGFGNSKRAVWSTGVELTRSIWSRERLRAHVLVGTSYLGANTYFMETFAGQELRRRFHALAFGAGLGIESRVGPLGLLFELPVTGVAALTSDTDLRFPGRFNVGLFPNVALCFYFRAFKRFRQSRYREGIP